MLAEKHTESMVREAWLVNTGWTGGPYDGVGHRMSIGFTRAMVHAALDGSLAKIETRPDPDLWRSCAGKLPGRTFSRFVTQEHLGRPCRIR